MPPANVQLHGVELTSQRFARMFVAFRPTRESAQPRNTHLRDKPTLPPEEIDPLLRDILDQKCAPARFVRNQTTASEAGGKRTMQPQRMPLLRDLAAGLCEFFDAMRSMIQDCDTVHSKFKFAKRSIMQWRRLRVRRKNRLLPAGGKQGGHPTLLSSVSLLLSVNLSAQANRVQFFV